MSETLADQLIEVLLQAGVERIYGVTGDSLNPVVDSIRRHDGIEFVHVRNEEAGAFAAASEAQLTGRLAACAGSCGPGSIHLLQGDAVFTVDTGMCNVWAARYITPNGKRRVIGSFLHGSMANAMPHAIGAQLAYPDRQIISMSGDGGLGMLLGELLTIVKYDLPVKIMTFNNSALGMVKLEMMVDGLPDYQTDNGDVDYAAIAQAAGIHGIRVEQPADVRAALTEALAHPGPALVDLVTDPSVLSMPPHITEAQVKGFALAAGKIVLDGGIGEMIELARANVRTIPHPAIR